MLAEGVRRHKARMPLTKIVEEDAAQDMPRVVVEPPAPDATLPEEFLAQNITEGMLLFCRYIGIYPLYLYLPT